MKFYPLSKKDDVNVDSPYADFVEKYGSASTSQTQHTEKIREKGSKYFQSVYVTTQNIGPLTKKIRYQGMKRLEDIYVNNQTGEELTEEEIKEFEKFYYIKKWDDIITET